MGWCVTDWWTMASVRTRSASAKPASMSPFDHSIGASTSAPPLIHVGSGISPRSIAAKSSSVHLTSLQPSRPENTFPSV